MSTAQPSRRRPGAQVEVVRGLKGDPGDPRLLLANIAPGEAVTVDDNGDPAALSVATVADIVDPETPAGAAVVTATEAALAAEDAPAAAAAAAVSDALGAAGTITRTNLVVNPEATSNSTGFNQYYGSGGAGSTARVADPADASKWMFRQTWTTGTSAVNGGAGFGRSGNDDIPVTAGTTVTASIVAQPSRQQRLRIEAKFYTSGGSQVGSTAYGASQVLDAGTRARLSYTGVVPSTATRMTIQLAAIESGGFGVAWQNGDTLHVGYVLVEVGSSVGSYFSGATSGAAWSGTAGASTSTWTKTNVVFGAEVGQTVAPVESAKFTGTRPTHGGQSLATNIELSTGLAQKFAARAGWATGTAYAVYDVVYNADIFYYCLTAHTSASAFKTDLDAGRWRALSPMQLSVLNPPMGVEDFTNAAWSRAHPPLHPLPPTITYQASGFSLSGLLGASPQEEVWDTTTKFDRIGCLAQSVTVASQTFCGNGSNGSAARQPWDIETIMDVPAAADGKLLLSVASTATDPTPGVQVFIDGQPCTADLVPEPAASTSTKRGVLIDGIPTGRHLIRITLAGLNLRSVAAPAAATLTARGKTRTKLFILGDSWIEGGNDSTSKHAKWPHAIAPTIARLLGDDVEVFYGGQGSTGYTTTPGAPKTTFGDSDRLTALYSCAPAYVLVWGTQNDDANHASVQAAASAMFSAIGTNLPSAKILLVGPASTRRVGIGNRANSVAALRAAAAAASNVVGGYVISPYSDGWISGNGDLDTPDGQGSGDYMMHTDLNHPTLFGAAYYARRAFFELAWLALRQNPTGAGFKLSDL